MPFPFRHAHKGQSMNPVQDGMVRDDSNPCNWQVEWNNQVEDNEEEKEH